MILNTTTKKIQAFTDATATTTEPTFSASYADTTTTAFTPGGSDGSLTGTTPVDVIAVPAASTNRVVKEIQIYNADTVSHIITVRMLDTATSYIFQGFTVPSGKLLRYQDEIGWQVGEIVSPSANFANPTATAGPTAVNGAATTAMRSDAAPAVQLGSASQKGIVQVDGTTITASAGVISASPATTFANPTASVGLTAVNGVATSAMRSDAAPALSQSISPTWSGNHTFSNPILGASGSGTNPEYTFTGNTGYGFYFDSADTAIGIAATGAQIGFINNQTTNFTITGAGYSLAVISEGATLNQVTRYGTGAAQSALYRIQGARGTIASPTVINNGDRIGAINVRAFGGTSFVNLAEIDFVVAQASPSDTQMGGRITFSPSTPATIVPAEVLRLETANGLSMFGANVVINANRLLQLRVFTVSTLPAAPGDGFTAYVSDATVTTFGLVTVGGGTNHIPVYYNSATAAWMTG